MLYFVTVNYYSNELIEQLIQSIEDSSALEYRVIIVNNSPTDVSIYQLECESTVILESGENVGFGAGCNLGLDWVYQQDPQGIVWLINPDTVLGSQGWEQVPNLLAANPEVSILGTIVYEPTGTLWFAGGVFIPSQGAILEKNLLSLEGDADYVPCDWVTGCSLLINLGQFSECPTFDPDYFLYYEDFDFCRRYAAQGHIIGVTPKLSLIHAPSSITDTQVKDKFKHSTYSYLKTMEKYSPKQVLVSRFFRLIAHALILIFIKPEMAWGKFAGLAQYCQRSPLVKALLSPLKLTGSDVYFG
ncbi:glycosyltransferase [Laspinema sp. D1]|uniref:glycosyltransferase n=1 Tax=Laspinema palackyanum TaxID=3231601 RepID=UPI00348E061F|nr:glycosyltransferase [Laspinema sp. D2b]